MSKIIRLKEIDSTHKLALNMIESHQAFECAIIAEKQTNGVGRCGRTWVSGKGNLYATILKNKINVPKNVGQLSLAIACAVRESIAHFLPEDLDLFIHWPNDIYYRDKKISGILIGAVGDWLAISVGVNIQSVDVCTASSLADILKVSAIATEDVFQMVLKETDSWLEILKTDGFLSIKNYWMHHIIGVNGPVVIKNGDESLSGILRGIDDFGRLILEKDKRNLYISSGDMFMNEKTILVNYD